LSLTGYKQAPAMFSVFITGSNRGIGFEFARQYAAEGWRVYATCRNPDHSRPQSRNIAATTQIGDFLIEPRPKILGLQLADTEVGFKRVIDVAEGVVVALLQIPGMIVQQSVSQMRDGPFSDSPPDILP
jgi:NAD(P)-dependent dehydrogenase (short-subunit alcohol dehydrogenase family)